MYIWVDQDRRLNMVYNDTAIIFNKLPVKEEIDATDIQGCLYEPWAISGNSTANDLKYIYTFISNEMAMVVNYVNYYLAPGRPKRMDELTELANSLYNQIYRK